jgi:hypothetical protein
VRDVLARHLRHVPDDHHVSGWSVSELDPVAGDAVMALVTFAPGADAAPQVPQRQDA